MTSFNFVSSFDSYIGGGKTLTVPPFILFFNSIYFFYTLNIFVHNSYI